MTATQGRVEIRGLSVGYGGPPVLELDELTIEAGEFLSVLGPSGCGKSTLLSVLAGFVEPTTGTVLIDGEDVTHVAPNRRETGLVFQSYALFPHMTVRRNLEYGLRTRRVPRDERAERVRDALKLVDLVDFADRYPQQLSGGQQQRVAIARALVTRPRVLLLDEPLSNLDAKLRRQMRHELRELQREVGTTTVFVTHDQAEALALSDRVALLAHGDLEQLGTPEELYRTPRTRFAADFVGAANLLPVHDGDGGRTVLGRPVRLAGAAGATVALRPEHVRVVEAGGDAAPATVLSVGFAGERYEYRLRTADGTELLASPADGGRRFAEDESVGLTWSDDALLPLGAA
ncbi:ABC transporter ATP-binding protein [Promicromonospora sukumoe]|uniref:Putative spermidine/putrescine transport system ATP-binding protein n=1 Tax=Promicromonospora sukumoe TaxID=88382 RepID=A0A7W3J960_9MICO|nr:ABC transporter ATP-binding protein [Promicromonospora sukumoe]MBA8808561.1 putative spermidine/putrescine transport system ATP-binding protein [Promicromonospora sukumoe]